MNAEVMHFSSDLFLFHMVTTEYKMYVQFLL